VSVYILAWVIWHANSIFFTQCNIVICVLPHCTIFFSTLSHKRHDFRKEKKKVTENKIYVLFYLRSLSEIKLEFSWQDFRKIIKHQISLKSVQWGQSCFMRRDGGTIMIKLIVFFLRSLFSLVACLGVWWSR